MQFVIHCLDHADLSPQRLVHYDAHKAHLAAAAVKTLMAGPLLAADGSTMIGSLFVVEADSIDHVIDFNAHDPFNIAGIWRQIDINPFSMRIGILA